MKPKSDEEFRSELKRRPLRERNKASPKAENFNEGEEGIDDSEDVADVDTSAAKLYPDISAEVCSIKLSPSVEHAPGKKESPNPVHTLPTKTKSFPKKYYLYGILGLVIICCCCVILCNQIFASENPTPPKIDCILNNLEKEFHKQTQSFKVVSAALRKVFGPNPKQPAIIMLAATKGAETKTHNLALHLAKLVSDSDNFVLIKGRNMANMPPTLSKEYIDREINGTLNSSTLNAVFVDALDHIPAETAMIFHGYCDHENAKYKRAVFVMTISPGTEIKENIDLKNIDKIAETHLKNSWKDAHEDQVSSLLSRLAVSVVAVI